MSVDVANETRWTIEPKQFSDLGAWVLDQMRVSPDAELSLTFVDPETIAALHERWMGLKGPTDVMSFPMDQLRPGDPDRPTPAGILGDILICPDVAARQAQAAGHSVIEEMILLTCHGILHLLGFDHSTHEQEKRMFALQRTLMLTFLAQREGGLKEVFLPVGAEDMLAVYEREHPETLSVGHETINGERVHAPQKRDVISGPALSPQAQGGADTDSAVADSSAAETGTALPGDASGRRGVEKTGSTKPADKPHKPAGHRDDGGYGDDDSHSGGDDTHHDDDNPHDGGHSDDDGKDNQ